MEVLGTYLRTHWPEGLVLEDAVQLCMHTYRTGAGIPSPLRPFATREGLARAFAGLAACGWVRQPSPNVDVSGVEFWTAVIASLKNEWPWRYDPDEATAIAARFGTSG